MTAYDRLEKISFPGEIIEEILSRIPVKSLLRFRNVSKPWLSLISDPLFTRSTAAHRTALLFSAYDKSTRRRHLFSAAHVGGSLTHLISFDMLYSPATVQVQHLNGLLCFTFVDYFVKNNYAKAFVVNPSTRKIYKVPHPDSDRKWSVCFLFGFDESRNEHKILMIRICYNKTECMLFSMSNHSWRMIDVEPPIGLSSITRTSVCVNSVIHMMPLGSHDIFGFDLRTEKFSIINTPQAVWSRLRTSRFLSIDYKPHIIKIDGCIGVVCHHHVDGNREMHMWILRDYENRVSTILGSN